MIARRCLLPLGLVATAAAAADAPPPPISVGVRETFDAWDDASGGLNTGTTLLNKLQMSGTVQGALIGLDGLSAHVQIFRTDGHSLSSRVGDIQTVSNIEAPPSIRLFEAWLEEKVGDEQRSLGLRAGLMDLNAQFDSNDSASLFINSSHGIGPDISRSGRNGPSIFPVTSAAATVSLLLGKTWTFRVAVFDGVPGDPDRPKAFAIARLGHGDGALVIGQVDYHLSDDATIEGGAWRYTAAVRAIDPARARVHDQGAYASLAAPIPGFKGWSGWVRAGIADRDAQPVSAYLGAGLVAPGLFAGRPDDRIGFAVAHAAIGAPSRAAFGLPHAETTFEATYQIEMHRTLVLQPDAQFVRHPAGRAGATNAVALGLRAVVTFGYPVQPSAIDAADPTVPPE
ncbi:MAG TPA: carbohydrate porin [Sphingomonas sp.]|uniref:carbohydrate porin n=1 Tax=Sphingomonas sp. TaxID=28214 RepID=UPI002B52E721|nr:carbohydrate porin [Sphingomonas sp.]HMI21194.1 carbohydrate porin [Sphingomonas sp.]